MRPLLFVFFIIASVSFGQEVKDAKSQGILDKLSVKMKGLKSFYIEYSSTTKNTSTGVNTPSTGKGWVKDNKFYASYGDNTIVSNGLKQWTIVKSEKTVYVSDVNASESDAINPKKLLTIWETGFKNKYEKEETLNGETVHVINLYPKTPAKADYHTIILYISKAKNEMKKVILKSKDGTVVTYLITKFTTNEIIEDAKFVFDIKKYPGYKTVTD